MAKQTQQERKARSERLILRAAVANFARSGFKGARLTEIGDSAGYTGGLVTHRYGNKAGLLKAVVDRIASGFHANQLRPSDGADDLRSWLFEVVRVYLQEANLPDGRMRAMYVLMGESLGSIKSIQPQMADLNARLRADLRAGLTRAVDQGELPADFDLDAASFALLALLSGASLQLLVDPALKPAEVIPQVQHAAVAVLHRPGW